MKDSCRILKLEFEQIFLSTDLELSSKFPGNKFALL